MDFQPFCNISDFDIFAKRLGLYHNRKEKIGSFFGFSLTVIYILISLLIFIYYTISTIKGKDLQVHDSTEYSKDIPYINLNNSNLLYFAFGVENSVFASRFVDETIYTVRAVYYFGEKNSGGAFKTIENRDLKIEKCKVEKFGKEYQHLFTKGELDNSYCVDNFDFALTGGLIYSQFSCIRILLYPCVNTTENNNHCKPQEEIDKVLAGGYFSFLLKDIGLNPTNYSFPILPTIQNFYTTISKDFFRDVIFNYEITEIQTDYGLFFEEKKTERYLRFDKIKENIFLRDDKDYYYKGKNMSKVEIRLNDNIHVQRRSHKKMSTVFSTTGGYMQVLYTIFVLLSFIPNKFVFETIIVNSLLNLQFSNNKINNHHNNFNFKNIITDNSNNINYNSRNINNISNESKNRSIGLKCEVKRNNEFHYTQKNVLINIKKNGKILSSIKDENSIDKIRNVTFLERNDNFSKLEMVPRNIEFNIIDKMSFTKSNSHKFLFNYPKENSFFNRAKGKGIKEIHFNICEYYCFGKCLNKSKKKIDLFHKGCLLYRDEMDIIHIFKHLLDMERTMTEKNSLKEDMKIFS